MEKEPKNVLLSQYEAMINAFDAAVFIVDHTENGDYRFRILNNQVADTIGSTQSNLLGKTLTDIFEPEIAQKMKANYDRCLKENKAIEYEEELILTNRKTFWRTRLSPLFENNAVIGILGVSRNITLQKSMRDTLVESENKHQIYMENSPHAVFVADQNGNYLEVNQMAAKITGYTKEELLKMNLKELIPQEYTENGVAHFEQLKKDGKACSDIKYRHKDGTLRWWTIDAVKLNETTFLGFAQDITVEKKARQKLFENEQLFQAMLNAIPDMVSVHDVEMNILYSNWNGFAAVDRSKRILNTKCYRTYRDYDDLCPDCQARKVIETKTRHQAQAELADGTWVEIRVIPIFEYRSGDNDKEKKVKYFLEWVRDITDFKKKEEALQLQKEELEASNEQLEAYNEEIKALNEELTESEKKANALSQAKSEFLANMSHELRTPLNGILGLSRLMKETKIDEEQDDYLKCVIFSGELLLETVNDILDFSKIEAGKLILEEKDTDIKEMLSKTFHLIAVEKNNHQLHHELKIDDRIPKIIKTDPLRLNQVITNLLNNAFKFTEKGTVLLQADLLSLSNTKTTVKFIVKDTGIGISDDQKETIFDMFTQGDSSTTRKYGGTGLGLPISVKILEQMGSKIHLKTELSKGSTFSFVCDFKLPIQ
ncbi:MAG: PAS domain S-box protein [Thermotogota bacterium]